MQHMNVRILLCEFSAWLVIGVGFLTCPPPGQILLCRLARAAVAYVPAEILRSGVCAAVATKKDANRPGKRPSCRLGAMRGYSLLCRVCPLLKVCLRA